MSDLMMSDFVCSAAVSIQAVYRGPVGTEGQTGIGVRSVPQVIWLGVWSVPKVRPGILLL
jgi:hypothetical protein